MNDRYSRQLLFREIGKAGQERLMNSRVLLVGAGVALATLPKHREPARSEPSAVPEASEVGA